MSEMCRTILFLFTMFVTNTIQVITGFAGAMMAMPPAIKLVGVESAKAVVSIVSGISSLYVTVRYFKNIDWRELLKIVSLMGIGLLLGTWLFRQLAFDVLLKAYGVIVILTALKKLFVHKEFQLPLWMMYLCLLTAGLIHGMFISGGSFLVVYAVWALKDKEKFRATVSAVWVVLNTYLLYDHYQNDYFTAKTLGLLPLSMIPFLCAAWLGSRLAKRISAEKFLLLTYCLLLLSGFIILI